MRKILGNNLENEEERATNFISANLDIAQEGNKEAADDPISAAITKLLRCLQTSGHSPQLSHQTPNEINHI